MISYVGKRFRIRDLLCVAIAVFLLAVSSPAFAQGTAFKQAIAEAAADDREIASFYVENDFRPLWTGADNDSRARRAALLDAFGAAARHGLPVTRYDVTKLREMMAGARSPRALGEIEVILTRAALRYARDVQSGVLIPSEVNKHIVRNVVYRDRMSYLTELATSDPVAFFASLPPSSSEYNALMKQKMVLERLIARGGWGAAVKAGKLEPGDSGAEVIALRDRLVRMGYMQRSAARSYDTALQGAVLRFQADHGLAEDGVVGDGTLAEINVPATSRLKSVVVAMERERWMNRDRGARHVEVNLADFTAKIIDDGKVTFQTRSVIGARSDDRQSPEFSDEMEHMILNPSWHVPRSIATKEYLPALQQDPNAAGHLIITDRSGRRVDRASMDFTQFTAGNFPFSMRQPPSGSNALGLVKFMFPNKYNIYLHDTPAKNLFGREARAYSHGCIRLADPFDFAYALLAVQTSDPKGFFQSQLARGQEVQVDLETHVPVHLIYRTAIAGVQGQPQYRRDIYGRDAAIWDALFRAGVELVDVQG